MLKSFENFHIRTVGYITDVETFAVVTKEQAWKFEVWFGHPEQSDKNPVLLHTVSGFVLEKDANLRAREWLANSLCGALNAMVRISNLEATYLLA